MWQHVLLSSVLGNAGTRPVLPIMYDGSPPRDGRYWLVYIWFLFLVVRETALSHTIQSSPSVCYRRKYVYRRPSSSNGPDESAYIYLQQYVFAVNGVRLERTRHPTSVWFSRGSERRWRSSSTQLIFIWKKGKSTSQQTICCCLYRPTQIYGEWWSDCWRPITTSSAFIRGEHPCCAQRSDERIHHRAVRA